MENVNIFKEKKKIYRLLAIAMAEDENVSLEEEMAIATVLMYRYCHSESHKEELMKIFHEKGFLAFGRYIRKTNNSWDKNDKDIFDKFKRINKKIACHKIRLETNDFQIKDAFNYLYKQKDIQLSQELKEDLLKSVLLEQLKADTRREQYRDCLLSAKKDISEIYTLKEDLFVKIEEDKSLSKKTQGMTLEENCRSLEEYYERRIRPLVQEYIELCMLCLLLVRQSLEELETDANGSVGKSIFMNINSLTKQEKTRELKEMVYVIKSDRSMMDREREAFRCVCKIFRIKGSSDLWKELSGSHSVKLLYSDVKSTRVHYKDSEMNVNDFKNVQQSICSFDVRGKLINGAFHILQRGEIRKRDEIYLSDKKWSSLAVWTFGVSALILYFFVADLVNRTSERPIIFELDKLNDFSRSISEWTMRSLFISGIIMIDWLLVKKFNIKKRIVLTSTVFIVLLSLSIHHCFYVKWSDMVATFFIPLMLVIMMLSIEWLIFMRQEYSGLAHNGGEPKEVKKGNASILIVLVCAAIMIDVCLGIVELITHSNIEEPVVALDYVAKIASALILGCICFFAGKFLDMYRMQQQTDMVKMKECINELEAIINK